MAWLSSDCSTFVMVACLHGKPMDRRRQKIRQRVRCESEASETQVKEMKGKEMEEMGWLDGDEEENGMAEEWRCEVMARKWDARGVLSLVTHLVGHLAVHKRASAALLHDFGAIVAGDLAERLGAVDDGIVHDLSIRQEEARVGCESRRIA